MKICLVKSKRVPNDLLTPTDGGSINFVEVLKGIEKLKKYSITVITRNGEDNISISESIMRDIKIIYLPFTFSNSNEVMVRDYEEGISFTSSLRKHLSQNFYDILLLAFAKNKYVDFYCPDYILEQEQNMLQYCNKIIALSCAEKNDIVTKYKIETNKITVIPNGVNIL